jgi:hypothetical protein
MGHARALPGDPAGAQRVARADARGHVHHLVRGGAAGRATARRAVAVEKNRRMHRFDNAFFFCFALR